MKTLAAKWNAFYERNFFALAAVLIIGIFAASAAHADDRIKANQSVYEFPTVAQTTVVGTDWVPFFDTSANEWRKVSASRLGTAGNSTILTAAGSLTTAQCGGTFYLNSATEFATTLPAPTAGCTFRFVVQAAPSGASYTVLTASSANIFIGHVESADLNAASDGDISTADDTITITDAKAVVGDVVEMRSNGTSWYYIGHSAVFDAIIATQAS